jgi:hypothetical protein
VSPGLAGQPSGRGSSQCRPLRTSRPSPNRVAGIKFRRRAAVTETTWRDPRALRRRRPIPPHGSGANGCSGITGAQPRPATTIGRTISAQMHDPIRGARLPSRLNMASDSRRQARIDGARRTGGPDSRRDLVGPGPPALPADRHLSCGRHAERRVGARRHLIVTRSGGVAWRALRHLGPAALPAARAMSATTWSRCILAATQPVSDRAHNRALRNRWSARQISR